MHSHPLSLRPHPPTNPPVLRTLDVLKKGSGELASAVRQATRFLEQHLGARLAVAPPSARAAVPPLPRPAADAAAGQLEDGDPPPPPPTAAEAWLVDQLETVAHYLSVGPPAILLLSSPPTLAAARADSAADAGFEERVEGERVREALVRAGLGQAVFWVEPEAGDGVRERKDGAGGGRKAGANTLPQALQPPPVLLQRRPPTLTTAPASAVQLLANPSRSSATSSQPSATAAAAAASPPSSPGRPAHRSAHAHAHPSLRQPSKLVLLQRPAQRAPSPPGPHADEPKPQPHQPQQQQRPVVLARRPQQPPSSAAGAQQEKQQQQPPPMRILKKPAAAAVPPPPAALPGTAPAQPTSARDGRLPAKGQRRKPKPPSSSSTPVPAVRILQRPA